MKTVGVDLHKCQMTIVVLDEQGAVIEQRQLPTKCRNQIREYFASLGPHTQVVVESVGFYYWFWELVHPLVAKLVLADPAGVRAFVGRQAKTDKLDAKLLADLLRDGRLPRAFVPAENLRILREMIRHRHSLARSLARERRQLRWLMLKNNLPGPTHLQSALVQKWLLAQEPKLSAIHQFAARQRLDHIIALERDLVDAEQLVARAVKAQPELAEPVALLQSVPGIGPIIAVTILAETGGLTRFDSIRRLGSYAGLVPKVSNSAETVHHGHITKQGPPVLRWALQQAAWVAIRTDPRARRLWARIMKRAGKKKASTALARKLLGYAWSVTRRGQPFHWPTETVPPPPNVAWGYCI